MPKILSIGTETPPYCVSQNEVMTFTKTLFDESYEDLDRLLTVFQNGQISKRYFSAPLEWFGKKRSFQEKNDRYIEMALKHGEKVIRNCLDNAMFLKEPLSTETIDAFFFVSTTGLSTPSIDARLMNNLNFSSHMKRVPIWGLGCAGGASGLARACEFCLAYPTASALLVSVELCSLTFQHGDLSKSNLIGTSLFGDGLACVLVVGDQSPLLDYAEKTTLPAIQASESTIMPNSEDVMGWEIKNEGLFVVFSKDIPHLVKTWFKPNLLSFLEKNKIEEFDYFIGHPGGKKVLDAYEEAFQMSNELTKTSRDVLQFYGNMSAPTVLFVLEEVMNRTVSLGDYGLVAALGPGFSSELSLLKWEGLK